MKSAKFVAAAILLASAGVASAQMAGLSRTDVLRSDSSQPGIEVMQVRVGFAPGTAAPNHSHPGEEIAYVLEGTLEYKLEGKPAVTLRAGEALFIPAQTNHTARNVGNGPAVELATYIVRRGEPLVRIAK